MVSTNEKIELPEILYYSYYTLGPSTVSPYHSHSYYEFTYLFECDGVYNVDGKKTKVKRGDTILFPPGCKHSEIITEGQQFNLFVVGLEGFDFSSFPNFYNNFGYATPFIDTGVYSETIANCCEEIRSEILNCNIGYRTIVKVLIEKLVVLLIRSKTNHFTPKNNLENQLCIDYSNKKDIVNKIKSYIDFYYSSKISLEDIAHNVYLSPTYVIKIFKEEMGETPINYLIKLRITKAKELLAQGKLSVEEIVEMIGYSDIVHFSKLFKKYTGYSPTQYYKSLKST